MNWHDRRNQPLFTVVVIAYLSACVLAAWVRGGRLRSTIPGLHYPVIGALLQVSAAMLLPGTLWTRVAGIVGFLLVLPFWWVNRRSPGVTVLVTGILLNLAVMLLNGGSMPVDAGKAAAVGVPMGTQTSARHQPITERTMLPMLGDVIPVAPLGKVVSVGDVVALVGVFLSIQEWMGRPLWRRSRWLAGR